MPVLHDHNKMLKGKQWDYLRKVIKKDKRKDTAKDDFITVQRLSAQVEGKAQKYSRNGGIDHGANACQGA